MRISGGSQADPTAEILDTLEHKQLHAAANSIAKHIREARRELDNAKWELERVVGRWRQPEHDRKGLISSEDLSLSVQRSKERMSAGGEMERVQRSGS